jgi:hypothetical protein
LHIGKAAGTLTPHIVEDIAKRANLPRLHPFARTTGIGLRHRGPRGCRRPEQQKNNKGRKIPHGSAFYCGRYELSMNRPASLRSATDSQYTRSFGRSNKTHPEKE